MSGMSPARWKLLGTVLQHKLLLDLYTSKEMSNCYKLLTCFPSFTSFVHIPNVINCINFNYFWKSFLPQMNSCNLDIISLTIHFHLFYVEPLLPLVQPPTRTSEVCCSATSLAFSFNCGPLDIYYWNMPRETNHRGLC